MNLPPFPSDLEPTPEAAQASRARGVLLKRLADVVCLPMSRVNAFERAMTADLLVDMLREAEPAERKKVARRLAGLVEIPASLVRLLLRDESDVAEELLINAVVLSDADLLDCARMTGLEHRRLIALRRGVSEVVCDVLIEFGEILVLECLLRNDDARFSTGGVEAVVALTRGDARLTATLLRRPELRPAHAYVLFWWADAETRMIILQRFAVSREVLQEAASDIFAMAAEENWQDALSRKALQFIERRQRNRAAIDKSPFDSLEDAMAAAQHGLTREIAEEISYLSGLKPMTGAKIFTDPGGEPIAVLCKATGLPKPAIRALWRGLKRSESDGAGGMAPALERAMLVYDMIAVDRAQTVLRYWNWSLTSALTPALLRAIRDGDEDSLDEYSAPQRAAMLALSKDFGR
ncbi:DUF2336 domain-containing protein [Phenylobacterium sp. Root700]|uniref:DUF2336 domain-containing protein n=1 Tax=Phenylobacterium sp. Root700 TaxID=1736591 RepID=UPI0007004718|nr:DUF2336 domain-containing protein [Phenylobacterium sp. Root700]KRB48966.1 hypothetical protein ASE02_01325 [Phenylobacterium sp. Root700]